MPSNPFAFAFSAADIDLDPDDEDRPPAAAADVPGATAAAVEPVAAALLEPRAHGLGELVGGSLVFFFFSRLGGFLGIFGILCFFSCACR
jgi:hypothetical protein